jgi:hypothetical protein
MHRAVIRSVYRPTVAAGVAAFAGLAASASASMPEPRKAAPPVLVVDYAGAGALLVDKKDQALKEALAMMPARLRELPREVPGMDNIPAPVLDAALMLLTKPARLAVTFDEARQDEGMFGLGAVLSFGPGEQQAVSRMHGTFNALLAMAGNAGMAEPSAVYDQMLEIPSPLGGVVRYGPRNAADGWRYEVHAGIADDPDAVFGAVPEAAAGVTPVARARLDFRTIGPAIEQNLELMGGPEGEHVGEMLRQVGIVGPDALRYVWQTGYTDNERVSYAVIEGLKNHAEAMGVPTEPLDDAAFAMIPADASVAAIFRYDLSASLATLEQAMRSEPQAAEGLEKFEGATGVDPFADLLGCLGGTFGFYMSESTGGQLGSMIAFASLSDRGRFEEAHSKLVGFGNTLLASEEAARGYARVRAWEDGETKLFSLSFPGLPIPAEVTWALQGNWVVMGMMPQSTLAAARQIAGKGDEGLRSNKAFTALLPKGKPVGSFSFIDTPRVMKDGYQYVALLGSAVANAARSPRDTGREPGMVVPTFRELRQGAKPMISFSYWRGEDHVTESHADRSFLVNACGVVGAASPAFPLIGMAIGAAAGAGDRVDPDMMEGMFDHLLMLP